MGNMSAVTRYPASDMSTGLGRAQQLSKCQILVNNVVWTTDTQTSFKVVARNLDPVPGAGMLRVVDTKWTAPSKVTWVDVVCKLNLRNRCVSHTG